MKEEQVANIISTNMLGQLFDELKPDEQGYVNFVASQISALYRVDREKLISFFVNERIRHTENYEKHRELKPNDKQALDYGLGYCGALQFCIDNVSQILDLLQPPEKELCPEEMEEMAKGGVAPNDHEAYKANLKFIKEDELQTTCPECNGRGWVTRYEGGK